MQSALMPETAQPTPETDEKKSRGLGSYAAWAFVTVMVYFLSAGPAERMREETQQLNRRLNYELNPIIFAFYEPWRYLYFSTPLHKPIGLYMHLWDPKHFDKNGDVWD
jgi:hypothetical protein